LFVVGGGGGGGGVLLRGCLQLTYQDVHVCAGPVGATSGPYPLPRNFLAGQHTKIGRAPSKGVPTVDLPERVCSRWHRRSKPPSLGRGPYPPPRSSLSGVHMSRP